MAPRAASMALPGSRTAVALRWILGWRGPGPFAGRTPVLSFRMSSGKSTHQATQSLLREGPAGERAATDQSAESYPAWVDGGIAKRVPWQVVLGIWIAYGLLATLQQEAIGLLNNQPIPLLSSVALELPQALVWAALTPFVLWVGRRFPVRGSGWPYRVPFHLVIASTLVFVVNGLFVVYAPFALPNYRV